MTLDRNLKLLGPIHQGQRIIEIGASYNPIVPRSGGWNTTIVDHDTREGLRAKYRNTPWVDPNNIESVDHVWRGGPLHSLFPKDALGSYNALIASHVIEHMLDPIGFLGSCSELLAPVDATVVLAIPDKRLSLDFRLFPAPVDHRPTVGRLRRRSHPASNLCAL